MTISTTVSTSIRLCPRPCPYQNKTVYSPPLIFFDRVHDFVLVTSDSLVALSTCESEYIALSFACQEAAFLQQITMDMQAFNCQNPIPVVIFVDNLGTIELSRNPVFQKRSKHIDIRYHFIRSKVADGSVVLDYVQSKSNVADIFTKPATKSSLNNLEVVKPV